MPKLHLWIDFAQDQGGRDVLFIVRARATNHARALAAAAQGAGMRINGYKLIETVIKASTGASRRLELVFEHVDSRVSALRPLAIRDLFQSLAETAQADVSTPSPPSPSPTEGSDAEAPKPAV